MITEVVDLSLSLNKEVYEKAGNIIKNGGLVAFPTETVYGLGGDALNKEASKKIYEAKGRPSDNPLIVHVADIEDVYTIADRIDERGRLLMQTYWPGPLTIIFNKKDIVPFETTGGLTTVAIRMPNNEYALEFIREAGGFVAAPSANSSGRPSPTKAEHVYEDLNGKIDMILDGKESGIGVESTIVDLSGDVPMLLRPGYITIDMLRETLGEVLIDPTILGQVSNDLKPKAPGMKYKHYAPKAELYIVKGSDEAVASYINNEIKKKSLEGEVLGIITTDENALRYNDGIIKCVGSRADEETIARHLFAILRDFDKTGVKVIYSEELNTPRMGMAVMNRLLKAAAHRVINV